MSTANIELPPLDGSIGHVLPDFVDFHAKHNPDLPHYVFPYPNLDSDELRAMSHREFAQATSRVAHHFRPNREGPEGAVVAVILNVDTLLYHAILIGLVRAGCIPFAMSPRNSAPAIASMMERTQCHRVISQPVFAKLMADVRGVLPAGYDMRVDEPPALTFVYPSLALPSPTNRTTQLPVPESYPSPPEKPSLDSVAFYLHSSGSTGHPKPVPQTHQFILQWCLFNSISHGRTHGIRWGAHALPPFHTMGIATHILAPLVSGQPTSLFPPRAVDNATPVVPTPETTILNAKKTACNVIFSVPAFLETWAQDDEDIEFLKTLKYLLYAGGPLSKTSGDKLVSRGVHLVMAYGATEVGITTADFSVYDNKQGGSDMEKAPEDWEWITVDRRCKPRWVDQGDGTYELQLLECPTHRPAIENLELPNGERGYATSDLFIPHPVKPGLWKIVGRNDDVIVLGSGEKTVPAPLEGHIGAHPLVSGVVAFGRGHQQIGILVEPKAVYALDPTDAEAVAQFRNTIWPCVEEANGVVPAFSRVFKEMILITDPSRPLPRVVKGTVQKKKALELYAQDIENLYKTVEDSANAHGVAPPVSWDVQDVQNWLSQHAASVQGDKAVDPGRDLFEQGFDSLSATFLRNRIIGALRGSPDSSINDIAQHIPQNFVFQHPTLASLARAVSGIVRSDDSLLKSPSQEIEELIKKFTSVLPEHIPDTGDIDNRERVVLVTGTTGNLGAHVLALLLSDEKTKRIYALNRGSGLMHRHKAVFSAAQLPSGLLDSPKLVLYSVDFAQSDLGLSQEVIDKLGRELTHVVHNAWRVDFNLALTSFETHIASAIRLLTLAPTAHYLFTSSISVAAGWTVDKRYRNSLVPEAALHDSALAANTSGYGMSKFVVEEVLSNARLRGFRTTALRIGQISGSSQSGAWNTSEWIPSIVKSSLALGAFPQSDSVVSWVPMDAVANAVVDLVVGRKVPELINVAHPRPVKWGDVFGAMQTELGVALPYISIDAWVKKLEVIADNVSASDLERVPAVKLLDYFRALSKAEKETQGAGAIAMEAGGFPLFETNRATEVSQTLANLPPLSEKDARAWVKYWKRVEFLS